MNVSQTTDTNTGCDGLMWCKSLKDVSKDSAYNYLTFGF